METQILPTFEQFEVRCQEARKLRYNLFLQHQANIAPDAMAYLEKHRQCGTDEAFKLYTEDRDLYSIKQKELWELERPVKWFLEYYNEGNFEQALKYWDF